MDTDSDLLLHRLAHNFLLCLADFPADLQPEHLSVPLEQQHMLYSGLVQLHTLIAAVYEHFARLEPASEPRWADRETCYRAIEGPMRLLWALGTAGRLVEAPGALGLQVSRAELDRTLRLRSGKDPASALAVLEALGFRVDYLGASGYKKCTSIAVRAPGDSEPLLHAMGYYAAHLPIIKNGLPFELYLRADFRPLLPGYSIRLPHLPLEMKEATRTFDPATRDMWHEIMAFTAARYPQYRPYIRVPRLRSRGWLADFSTTGKDYGTWTIIGEEGGFWMRIAPKPQGYQYILTHIDQFSPRFQEIYLNCSACSDCTHCGKHFFFQHGDHVHRLCKGPWFYSPYLKPEDIADVERLIDIHLANLN